MGDNVIMKFFTKLYLRIYKDAKLSGVNMKVERIGIDRIKDKLQNNMPLVIIGSLALVVGLIALSNRRFA